MRRNRMMNSRKTQFIDHNVLPRLSFKNESKKHSE